MNILYIAYSCNPYAGSEDKIGWKVPVESAKNNVVYVITKEEQRAAINKYLKEHPLKNITFFFVDIPKIYKKIFRGFMYSGRLNIWNQRALPLAKKICAMKQIDIIHQITPIEFRAIGDYGKIQRIKFVCGPLGGGEFIPSGLKVYARGHELIESVRSIMNRWHRFKLRRLGKLKKCDYIMYANEETRDFVNADVDLLPITEIGIDGDESRKSEKSNPNQYCTFLIAGRMIYRKGHDFLLDALMRVPSNLNYICRIVGGGAEKDKLQARCSKSDNLSKHVVFVGPLPYGEMEKEYENADVLIVPSIRETTGTVLLEAMSKGLPAVTINKFGGAILLDNDTGWLYDGKTKDSYIDNLKDVIVDCILNPSEVRRRGNNARRKVKQYTWAAKNEYYQRVYRELLKEESDEKNIICN